MRVLIKQLLLLLLLQDSGHAGTGHAGTARKSSKAPDMQVLTDRDTHKQTPRDTRGRQSVLVNASARTTTDWGMCPNSDPKSYLYWYDKVPVQVCFRALSGSPNRGEAGETFGISPEPRRRSPVALGRGRVPPQRGSTLTPAGISPGAKGRLDRFNRGYQPSARWAVTLLWGATGRGRHPTPAGPDS